MADFRRYPGLWYRGDGTEPGWGVTLYTPATQEAGGADRRPGVILVHGGGWSDRDRGDMDSTAETFAGRTDWPGGIPAATINYRLVAEGSDVTIEDQLEDVKMAVEWFKGLSCVDPNNVWLVGESAGGHLALMHGIRERNVRGVLTWGAPTDLAYLADKSEWWKSILARLAGTSEDQLTEERLKEMSPRWQPGLGEASPMTLLISEQDILFQWENQGEPMVQAVSDAGGKVIGHEVVGEDHLIHDTPQLVWKFLADMGANLEVYGKYKE
jgi:acetyl esterase/lipase